MIFIIKTSKWRSVENCAQILRCFRILADGRAAPSRFSLLSLHIVVVHSHMMMMLVGVSKACSICRIETGSDEDI